MRVVHFIHRYPPALGGSEAFFARLGRFLALQGVEISTWTSNALDLEAFWSPSGRQLTPGKTVEDGVEVRRYPIKHWPGRRYLLKAASFVPIQSLQWLAQPCNPILPGMWRDAGRERGFDIVHATAFPYSFPLACGLRLARRNRCPFVLSPFLHLGDPGDPHDRTRRSYLAKHLRSLLFEADTIFVQTQVERNAIHQLGIPSERLHLLGMGVDSSECTGGNRSEARERWNLGADRVVIGHLANKSREKGTVDLLIAAERLWQRGLRFQLLLAGPEMPNYRQFWASFGSKENVRSVGSLSDTEKRDLFAASDLFAMPSRSDSFGIVFLEAWANGIPCVGYRAGGVAEVIQHESDGLLAPCGDVAALAEVLQVLVTQPDYRRRLGERGQAKVRKEFTWQPRLELVRNVYSASAKVRGAIGR